MLDISPEITPPQPVRLADYRPPDFLIDTVDLVFELGDRDTRVKSRLRMRRNPEDSDRGTPLHLDGEALELVSLALDGEPLGANRYQLPPEGGLIVADVPDAFTLDIETRISTRKQHRALRPLHVGRQFLHPVRARRLSPDHLFRRSAGCHGPLHDDDHRRKGRFPVLLSNGNPVEHGEIGDGRHWAKWVDPHPKPSYLFALVAGDLVAVRDRISRRARAKRWHLPSGCAAATRTNAAMRWLR